MLAKSVATEAGANFINISMSSITSKVVQEQAQFAYYIVSSDVITRSAFILITPITFLFLLAVVWRGREICQGCLFAS